MYVDNVGAWYTLTQVCNMILTMNDTKDKMKKKLKPQDGWSISLQLRVKDRELLLNLNFLLNIDFKRTKRVSIEWPENRNRSFNSKRVKNQNIFAIGEITVKCIMRFLKIACTFKKKCCITFYFNLQRI